MNSYKRTIVILSVVAIIGLGFSLSNFMSTALSGFTIYEKAQEGNQSVEEYVKGIDLLKVELGDLGTDISSCYDLNKELLEKLEDKVLEISNCKTEKEQLNTSFFIELQNKEKENQKIVESKDVEIESLNDQIKDLKSDLDKNSEDYDTLQNNYNLLVSNTANNICCKAKIDNPSIKYYKVEDSRIACSTQSGTELNCGF